MRAAGYCLVASTVLMFALVEASKVSMDVWMSAWSEKRLGNTAGVRNNLLTPIKQHINHDMNT